MGTLSDTGNLCGSTHGGVVLLLEPEGRDSFALSDALREAGFEVVTTSDASEAARIGQDRPLDLFILDEALATDEVRAVELATAVILLADEEQATGGFDPDVFLDVLVRPVATDHVLAMARVAAKMSRLARRNAKLEKELTGFRSGSALVGCSPLIRRLCTVLSRASENDATVLIEGKPGTGKTLAAKIIHAKGRRSDRQLFSVASASLDDNGVTRLLREADGATILLEDVDQLPPQAQAVLVRFLKERPRRGEQTDQPDIRLFTTTSARLPEQVARGAFREDLYYRLSLFPVAMPSLHERREDIALLAMHFLKRVCEDVGTPVRGFTPTSMILMESHPWPGNAAQMETAILRAHSLAGGGPIDRMHLLGPGTGLEADHEIHFNPHPVAEGNGGEEATEKDILPLEEEEKRLLTRALKATGGNVRRASQLLGIGRATLYRKIQIYKLKLN